MSKIVTTEVDLTIEGEVDDEKIEFLQNTDMDIEDAVGTGYREFFENYIPDDEIVDLQVDVEVTENE